MPKLSIGTQVRYTPLDVRSIALTQAVEIWVLADASKPEDDLMDFACKMPDGTLTVVKAMCRDFAPLKSQATLQPMPAYTHRAPDGTRHPARKVVIDEVRADGVVLRDEQGGALPRAISGDDEWGQRGSGLGVLLVPVLPCAHEAQGRR